jgi:hypothetical protein
MLLGGSGNVFCLGTAFWTGQPVETTLSRVYFTALSETKIKVK